MERPISIENVKEWATESIWEITGVLTQARNKILQANTPSASLCGNDYVLSEMPLCTGLKGLSSPYGCKLVTAWATFPMDYENRDGRKFGDLHTYFQSYDGRNVVCVLPGQFIVLNRPAKPGDRISILQNLAPNLIYKINDQIAVLYGSYGEIFDILQINYSDQL